jgi:nucleotide-binding universal stress UspA family protein
MTIARILVPLAGGGPEEALVDHAIALARPFAAHVEAVHFAAARRREMLPFGVDLPGPLKAQIGRSMAEVEAREAGDLDMLLNRLKAREDIALVTGGTPPPRDRASLRWREGTGRPAALVAAEGRLADLVIVAQPEEPGGTGAELLQAALMATGRPVCMCPSRPVAGEPLAHVAIAWNGSEQAARSLALAGPLVRAAGKVTVLSVGAEAPAGADADALAAYLDLHGTATQRLDLSASGSIGGVLLDGVRAAGASLLVMGAFGHSPGHEALFGGASRYVIDRAGLPVVMAH